ncbi:hypothetical protein DIPPA_20184 [Diplonema papillatum]|nr:hypothetical protein DIPPA_20184 [Diplonema papillatum]|eukprot:gene21878-33614_t
MGKLLVITIALAAACGAGAAAGSCFEAFTPNYPKCRGYEKYGYICRGNWCVTDTCVGDCSHCSKEVQGGLPDYHVGRCVVAQPLAVDTWGEGRGGHAATRAPTLFALLFDPATLKVAAMCGMCSFALQLLPRWISFLDIPLLLVLSFALSFYSMDTAVLMASSSVLLVFGRLLAGTLAVFNSVTFFIIGLVAGAASLLVAEHQFPWALDAMRFFVKYSV